MRISVRAGQAYGTGTFGRIAERKGQMERRDERVGEEVHGGRTGEEAAERVGGIAVRGLTIGEWAAAQRRAN